MAAAHIARRRWLNAKSEPVVRYHVRARLGGRGWPLIHLGSFKTVREAEIRLRFVEDEIAAGRDPRAALTDAATADVSVADAATQWLDSRHDYAEKTRKRAAIDVRRLAKCGIGRRPVKALTRTDIERHVADDLVASGLSTGSIRNAMTTLKQILDHAGCDPNPARSRAVKIPKEQRKTVSIPTREEAERIKAAATGEYPLVIRMLEATGARAGELCAMEWDDVDLDRARWLIRGTKTRASLRPVPLPDDVVAALRERDRATVRVFPQVSLQTLWRGVNGACKRAGVVVYNPKAFRHLYGSRLVAAGIPIPEVSRLMGHANQTTTMSYYLHVLPEQSERDVAVMDAIG